MTIRRALSAIRLAQWTDIQPQLRIRVTSARAAACPSLAPLRRELGQGLAMQPVIVVHGSGGEATIPIQPTLITSWDRQPADVWAAAVANTCTAALRQERATTRSKYREWQLTFCIGRDTVAITTNQILDRSGAATGTGWWSVLSPQAMVSIHPLGQPSGPVGQAAAQLVADLASITEDPLPANLFPVTSESAGAT